MKNKEKINNQPIDFINRDNTESKINNFLDLLKKHKIIIITSFTSIIVIILIIVLVIIFSKSKNNSTEAVDTNTLENINVVNPELSKEQEVTLQTDTNGLTDGTEVAVIKNDDGTIEVIAKTDPKFEERTAGKNYSTGTIENGGVYLKTNDNDLITIASKPQEEQKNNIKVENNTVSNATITEQKPETTTNNQQSSTSNGNTSSSSKPSGTTTTKPSGNSASSSSKNNSNKPSGGSSSSSGSSTTSGGGSSSSGSSGSTSSKPAHEPFSTYNKYNASKTAQAVSWLKDEINKIGDSQYATVKASSSRPSGKTYSTFNEANARRKVSGGAVGTVYVYVEDTYMYDSSGTTANIFDTPMYIWIVN